MSSLWVSDEKHENAAGIIMQSKEEKDTSFMILLSKAPWQDQGVTSGSNLKGPAGQAGKTL